jgi:hypothetical protein
LLTVRSKSVAGRVTTILLQCVVLRKSCLSKIVQFRVVDHERACRTGCQSPVNVLPQIFGGSPGSGSSSFSRCVKAPGAGKNTVSRSFFRPFPLSLWAKGFQHSEQISYSLPSISFCRQFFASPQRSQIIMDRSLLVGATAWFSRTTVDFRVLKGQFVATLCPTFFQFTWPNAFRNSSLAAAQWLQVLWSNQECPRS